MNALEDEFASKARKHLVAETCVQILQRQFENTFHIVRKVRCRYD